jgi:hypothetical protein
MAYIRKQGRAIVMNDEDDENLKMALELSMQEYAERYSIRRGFRYMINYGFIVSDQP